MNEKTPSENNTEKPEIKNDNANEPESEIAKVSESREVENWSKDQRERGYYYDDSYGYQKYDPDDDSEEE